MPEQTRAVVAVSPKERYTGLQQAIERRRQDILHTLPATIDPDRFISVALQALTRSPRLLECSPESVIKSLRDAAELGLEPSGLMGSAYLVPYRNSKTGKYEAQLIPGYRGLIDLARRSTEVRTIEAHVVRERDRFEFNYGSAPAIIHVPYINLTQEREEHVDEESGEVKYGDLLTAGGFVAAYALARLKSGEVQFEVMDIPSIELVRRRSKAADNGPWVTDWHEMARKTVTRRLLKYLPLSVLELQRALELEDEAESTAEPERSSQQQAQPASTARRNLAQALRLPTDETASAEEEAAEAVEGEVITLDDVVMPPEDES